MFKNWKKQNEEKLFQTFRYQFHDLDQPLIRNWVFYQLTWYGKRANTYRRYSRIHTALSLASPALASLGLSSSENNCLRSPLLVLNAILIVAIGVLTSMRCTEQWIRYRTVCENLRRLTVEYLHNAQFLSTDDEKREASSCFLATIDNVIGKELDEWSKLELQHLRDTLGKDGQSKAS